MTPRRLPDLKRRRLAALLGLVAGTAWAQQPDDTARPIRWIVPFPTGAIADVVARAIGAQLTIDTGQPVQIENRPGGNTTLAALEAARAPADGHTVLSADNGMWVFNPALYRSLSYSPSRDFTPVTQLVRLPMVLLVGPASGVRDARAFIEDARAFPGRFSFASAGNGSPQHLAMELLAREAGLEMVHVPYRSLSYSPSRDFTPVTQLVRLPMVLLVGPASGVRDARAFIEDARAFPGRFSFASAGNGSAQHLAMALLAREAGLEMVHVPYRSAGPALVEVAGGQLPFAMGELATARRFIQGGRLRVLAVANPARLVQWPGVPTFAELGLPKVEAAIFHGLVAPAGTPPEVVARLQRAVASALHNPVVQRRLAEAGVEPVGGTPAEFETLLARESARWHPLIRALKLSFD